jgi:hypothetical protein
MSRFATSADVLLWYPSLSTTSPELMQAAIDAVECMFNVDVWGCNLLAGSTHATAHVLLMQAKAASASGSTGSAGPVSQMSMGPVSISYATGASSTTGDDWWRLTGAGQAYLALRELCGPVPFAAMAGQCDSWPSGARWPCR